MRMTLARMMTVRESSTAIVVLIVVVGLAGGN
jgi:hypothetical protein